MRPGTPNGPRGPYSRYRLLRLPGSHARGSSGGHHQTEPGEGLWKTASEAPTTFAIYVPDPVSEQVGFIGIMKADGKPIELALRQSTGPRA